MHWRAKRAPQYYERSLNILSLVHFVKLYLHRIKYKLLCWQFKFYKAIRQMLWTSDLICMYMWYLDFIRILILLTYIWITTYIKIVIKFNMGELCVQGLLLSPDPRILFAGSEDIWCQKLNIGWQYVRQMSYPLYYCSYSRY